MNHKDSSVVSVRIKADVATRLQEKLKINNTTLGQLVSQWIRDLIKNQERIEKDETKDV